MGNPLINPSITAVNDSQFRPKNLCAGFPSAAVSRFVMLEELISFDTTIKGNSVGITVDAVNISEFFTISALLADDSRNAAPRHAQKINSKASVIRFVFLMYFALPFLIPFTVMLMLEGLTNCLQFQKKHESLLYLLPRLLIFPWNPFHRSRPLT